MGPLDPQTAEQNLAGSAGSEAGVGTRINRAEQTRCLARDYAAEVSIKGGEQKITLQPKDFENYGGEPLSDWKGIRRLKLSPAEQLRPGRRQDGKPAPIGSQLERRTAKFRSLRWAVGVK